MFKKNKKEFKIICPFCKKEFTDAELWYHLKEHEKDI